jgi:hypothetical protein
MKSLLCAQVSAQTHPGLDPFEALSFESRNRVPVRKTVTRAPLLFRLAKTMTRWRIRGGDRLLEIFEQLGLLNIVVRYRLGAR